MLKYDTEELGIIKIPTVKAVVFDLDGTLVQTRDAMWTVFKETNLVFNLGFESPEMFYSLFDINFFEALESYIDKNQLGDSEQIKEHFLRGLIKSYMPTIVPGIVPVIKKLAEFYPLSIMTGNSMEATRRILLTHDLADCFGRVISADLRLDKKSAIEELINDPGAFCGRSCSPSYRESDQVLIKGPNEVMMVTDTVGDVVAAREAGIRVIGVAWGMHSCLALEEAGAERVCIWPDELLACLVPGGGDLLLGVEKVNRENSNTGGVEVELDADVTSSDLHRAGVVLPEGIPDRSASSAMRALRRRTAVAKRSKALLDASSPQVSRPDLREKGVLGNDVALDSEVLQECSCPPGGAVATVSDMAIEPGMVSEELTEDPPVAESGIGRTHRSVSDSELLLVLENSVMAVQRRSYH